MRKDGPSGRLTPRICNSIPSSEEGRLEKFIRDGGEALKWYAYPDFVCSDRFIFLFFLKT